MRIRSAFCLSISIFALTCLPLAGPAQQTDTDKPVLTLKVQSNEVLLPVTVRDKKGALVTSLKISDFTLTEDGRPQTIKSFTRESNLPYRLGLLVDTSRSVSGAMEEERKAAGKFVDTMLPAQPNATPDEAFLIHFDREVELLEDFTASREKLHRELDDEYFQEISDHLKQLRFRAGVLIGRIVMLEPMNAGALDQSAIVEPAANLAGLTRVLVVPK